jgi:ribosomal protein L29
MEIKDMKKMKKEELEKELQKMENELQVVKKDVRSGKEKNVKKSLRIKKNIARIHTVLNEK